MKRVSHPHVLTLKHFHHGHLKLFKEFSGLVVLCPYSQFHILFSFANVNKVVFFWLLFHLSSFRCELSSYGVICVLQILPARMVDFLDAPVPFIVSFS